MRQDGKYLNEGSADLQLKLQLASLPFGFLLLSRKLLSFIINVGVGTLVYVQFILKVAYRLLDVTLSIENIPDVAWQP